MSRSIPTFSSFATLSPLPPSPHPSGTGDAFCSIFTGWLERLGVGRVQDALVKATSTVQQLIRVTMELQHGSAVGSAGSSAEAVRSRELQVTWGALAAIMNTLFHVESR